MRRVVLALTRSTWAPYDDVGRGVLNWLASLSASPFVAPGFVARDPSWGSGYGTVVIDRVEIDGQPMRFIEPAATATILGTPNNWQILHVKISSSIAWATTAEIAALEGCAPAEPPLEITLRGATYRGVLRAADCSSNGDYAYVPAAADAVEWGDTGLGALDRWGGYGQDAVRWHVQRPAVLRLDATSTFPGIERSDATCGGVTGFALVIEAIDGGVLRYTPGIDCPRCI